MTLEDHSLLKKKHFVGFNFALHGLLGPFITEKKYIVGYY
jgi:hypothetical protein